jgi:hypothetical protein
VTAGVAPAIPCDVNAPVFSDGDGAARLAVDAQGRSQFGLPGFAPDVVNVSPLRLAGEIDLMQYAALIQRGFKTQKTATSW